MTAAAAIYDPRDRATINDPIPVFRSLQNDDPCHWCKPLKSWLVIRYKDVREILLDENIFTAKNMAKNGKNQVGAVRPRASP